MGKIGKPIDPIAIKQTVIGFKDIWNPGRAGDPRAGRQINGTDVIVVHREYTWPNGSVDTVEYKYTVDHFLKWGLITEDRIRRGMTVKEKDYSERARTTGSPYEGWGKRREELLNQIRQVARNTYSNPNLDYSTALLTRSWNDLKESKPKFIK